jgi:hypothetical protein
MGACALICMYVYKYVCMYFCLSHIAVYNGES